MTDFLICRYVYVIFDPGTYIFFRFRPKLVGLPKSQPKQISKMQFPKTGGCYIFQILLYFPKVNTVVRSRQIADFQGASYIAKRAQRPLIIIECPYFSKQIRQHIMFTILVSKIVKTPQI